MGFCKYCEKSYGRCECDKYANSLRDQIADLKCQLAEARKQAFEDAAKIAENTGMKSKWGSEYELACIQIAEALRRVRDEMSARGREVVRRPENALFQIETRFGFSGTMPAHRLAVETCLKIF